MMNFILKLIAYDLGKDRLGIETLLFCSLVKPRSVTDVTKQLIEQDICAHSCHCVKCLTEF